MKSTPFYILLLLLSFSCRKADLSELTVLETAFINDSQKQLNEFLKYWNEKFPPYTKAEIDTLNIYKKNAYLIFEKIYNPKDQSILSSVKWLDSLYKNVNFFLIQNSLKIEVADDFHLLNYNSEKQFNIIEKHVISDFRPDINISLCKNLFLNSEYKEIILTFLNYDLNKINDLPKYDIKDLENVSFKKAQFLYPEIAVFRSHWGDHWIIESHPQIDYILFDKKVSKAVVHFSAGYNAGEAKFIQKDTRWKMISSEITWGQ